MATNTTNNYFSKPAVGGDTDTWGTTLNSNWDAVDSIVTGGTSITRLGIGTTNSTLPLICNAASATDIAASFSGLVGIGTSSPSAKLHTVGDASNGTNLATSATNAKVRHENHSASSLSSFHGYTGNSWYTQIANNSGTTSYDLSLNPYGGNVGIGTDSPLSPLNVKSATGNVGFNYGTSSSPERGNLWYDTDGTEWQFNIGKVQSGTFTPQVTVATSGNVGIGTTSPDSKLDVAGVIKGGDVAATGGGTALSVKYITGHTLNNFGATYSSAETLIGFGVESHKSQANKFISTASNSNFTRGALTLDNELKFFNAASTTTAVGSEVTMTERMRIDASGNVGIGTTSPSSKLHVAGGATFDGGTSTTVDIKCDDAGNALLRLMGDNQGTGRLYVGQSSTYGGGIEYNGDSIPETSGGGSDYIALYRHTSQSGSAGTFWTARNHHNSNDWEFRGKVTAAELAGTLAASIFNQIYPVGAIYISTSSTSPATLFGGTWTAIGGGRVLQTVNGSSPSAGSNYSDNSRSISTSNLPAHTHNTNLRVEGGNKTMVDNSLAITVTSGDRLDHLDENSTDSTKTSSTGNGTAFNVQQASYGVYMWKRATLA